MRVAMEVGIFADDFFEQKEDKASGDAEEYKAKECFPKWFYEESPEVEQGADILKFKADHLYLMGNFEEAAACYKDLTEKYLENNSFMKKNILESTIRCYIKLGELDKAQKLAEEMHSTSKTFDCKTVSLNLLSAIYKQLGLHEGHRDILQQLITLHPMNHMLWLYLAGCYACINGMTLQKLSRPEIAGVPHVEAQDDHKGREVVGSCLIRVLLLIQAIRGLQGSFVLKKIKLLEKEVDAQITALGLPQHFIDQANKFLSRDLSGEDDSEETGASVLCQESAVKQETDFESVWFGWSTQ